MKKYKNTRKMTLFILICCFLIIIFVLYTILFSVWCTNQNIVKNVDTIPISDEQKVFCKEMYALFCLSQQKYSQSYDYLNQLNVAERNKKLNGNTVNRYNMNFFKKGDTEKSLLLYNGGGIGDGFMYARFIQIICEKFPGNKIILLSDRRTSWIYKKTFEHNKSVIVKYYSDEDIPHFDYHCNMICLIKYLGYEYDTIPFTPLFQGLNIEPSLICRQILWKLKNDTQEKKSYIFNWKGSEQNSHELKNRKMELEYARPLFEMKNVNWIIATRELTKEENKLLDEYENVKYYGNILDANGTYIDTFSIIKNVDAVISTDTSLLHLSANMNVKTYALLTLGCEWRWTKDPSKTNWYPEMRLFRQKEIGQWASVVAELIDELTSNKV